MLLQNLERYLKNEFESQKFQLTYEYVHSIENKIELKIPTDTVEKQGYKIVTYKRCQVSKIKWTLHSKGMSSILLCRFEKQQLNMPWRTRSTQRLLSPHIHHVYS